jgi:hypothetical protein
MGSTLPRMIDTVITPHACASAPRWARSRRLDWIWCSCHVPSLRAHLFRHRGGRGVLELSSA